MVQVENAQKEAEPLLVVGDTILDIQQIGDSMSYGVFGAFGEFQKTVDADVDIVNLARSRRDTFKAAFAKETDVEAIWGSGSLRRSTQLQPVHDVDLVVEYAVADHSEWGIDGASAAEAIEHAAQTVRRRLGTQGTDDQLVRQVNVADRNRSAKCFIDDPNDENAFTVDVMPALRQVDGTLLIPAARASRWDVADPELMIERVATRQSEWSRFRPTVRLLKKWSKVVTIEPRIKSLVIEVMALELLPERPSGPAAIAAFFSAAAVSSLEVVDPAGHCGPIQPDLNVADLRTLLEDAAQKSASAEALRISGDDAGAGRLWGEIFGDDFPVPPETLTAPAAGVAAGRPVKDSPQG